MSINRVNISGNLTRDAELRATQAGTSVLNFGVAVNDRRKNPQTGEWTDYTNFVECIVWGNRAQSLAQYLHKGMKVAIEGKLRWSSWDDKNTGQKRSKLEVIVDEIEFMSQPQQGGYQQAPQMPATAPQAPQFAPQMQQGYQSAAAPQMAPQMAPQAPAQSVVQTALSNVANMDDLYPDSIPF